MPKNLKLQKSFTLLEVLIAIFALTIGVMAAFGSIAQAISAATFAKNRLIASFLAQEGIEIVKNIRDSNWIQNKNWNEGLNPGDYQADYDDLSLSPYLNSFLNLSSNGYLYGIGNPTQFKRKITIQQTPNPKELIVAVQVSWQNYTFEATSTITNWLEPD